MEALLLILYLNRSEKCFEQKESEKWKHTIYVQYTFSVDLAVFEMIKQKILMLWHRVRPESLA
jgi:hypothetical protein